MSSTRAPTPASGTWKRRAGCAIPSGERRDAGRVAHQRRSPRTRSCRCRRGNGARRPPASLRSSRPFDATYHRPMSVGFDLSDKVVWVTGSSRGSGGGLPSTWPGPAPGSSCTPARPMRSARSPRQWRRSAPRCSRSPETCAPRRISRRRSQPMGRALRPARRHRGRGRRRGAGNAGRDRPRAFRRQLDLNLTSAFATVPGRLRAAARGGGCGGADLGHGDDERDAALRRATARPRRPSST